MYPCQDVGHAVMRKLILATILVLLALCGGSASAQNFPPALVEFGVPPGQLVFTPAGEGHWDAAIRERGWILHEGDDWRMWYTGYDGTPEGLRKLGYATSTDGVHWSRHPQGPLIDGFWVEDVQVLKHDGGYVMFAEGLNDQAQLLTSDDGLHWKREGTLDIRLTSGEPIPPGPFGTPTAWYEDGTWHLFYERRDAGVWLATSTDLKTFTNVQDEPVLALGPGDYDRQMIALNQIIKQGGQYYACYHGSGSAVPPRLWASAIATSTDLIHWVKFAGNPLSPPELNQSSGIIVPEGEGFRFYTMHGEVRLHRATSSN